MSGDGRSGFPRTCRPVTVPGVSSTERPEEGARPSVRPSAPLVDPRIIRLFFLLVLMLAVSLCIDPSHLFKLLTALFVLISY